MRSPRYFGYKKEFNIWEKLLIGFVSFIFISIVFEPKIESKNYTNNNLNNNSRLDIAPSQYTKKEYNLGDNHKTENYILTVNNLRVVTDIYGKKYRVIDLEVTGRNSTYVRFEVLGINSDNEEVYGEFAICGHSDLKGFTIMGEIAPGTKINGNRSFEIKDGKDIKKLRITEDGKDIFFNL